MAVLGIVGVNHTLKCSVNGKSDLVWQRQIPPPPPFPTPKKNSVGYERESNFPERTQQISNGVCIEVPWSKPVVKYVWT